MCGILTLICRSNTCDSPHKEIEEAKNSLACRGPDSHKEFKSGRFCAVFFRLAIRDLSSGEQPNIFNSWVTLINGELDNDQELRSRLADVHIAQDIPDGDMQILGASVSEFMEEALIAAKGMFAGCAYSLENQVMYFFRDAIGEKPLFYSLTEDHLLVCSDPFRIGGEQTIRKEELRASLISGFSKSGLTIFNGVRRVEPGEFYIFDTNLWHLSRRKYWNFENKQKGKKTSTSSNTSMAIKLLKQELHNTIKMQMQNDVPTALLLSGGLDSALVANFAMKDVDKRIPAYTLEFSDESYDESRAAKESAKALGMESRLVQLPRSEVETLVPQVLKAMKEPIFDPATISLFALCREVSKDYKVALTGDGGDELFRGYALYSAIKQLNLGIAFSRLFSFLNFSWASTMPFFDKVLENQYAGGKMKAERALTILSLPKVDPITVALSPIAGNIELIKTLSEIPNENTTSIFFTKENIETRYQTSILPKVYLSKSDRMSMIHGLELRSPLLSRQLFELVMHFKPFLVKFSKQEIISTLVDQELATLLQKRRKHGFAAPIHLYLRSFCVSNPFAAELGIPIQDLEAIRSRMLRGSQNAGIAYWALMVAEYFLFGKVESCN